jgi:hypothetical protein
MPVKPLLSPGDWEQFDKYAGLFVGESDRGAVLLAASYLDSLLGDLLSAASVDHKTLKGVVRTLSGRIRVAYALGLLPEDIREDLSSITQIRNKFAHYVEPASFATDAVRRMCAELNSTRWMERAFPRKVTTDPRVLFIWSVQTAMFYINRRKGELIKPKVPPNP